MDHLHPEIWSQQPKCESNCLPLDTVAYLIASMVSMTYDYFKLNSIYIVSFSFLVFIISRLPYAKFRKASSE
jgi:hypothetical protein